ncbi:MAG: hypothetical protein OXJ52_04670 [Oligoflexia bacterium]|nr:hypothetical protein [Oligoflexia bacterium]
MKFFFGDSCPCPCPRPRFHEGRLPTVAGTSFAGAPSFRGRLNSQLKFQTGSV